MPKRPEPHRRTVVASLAATLTALGGAAAQPGPASRPDASVPAEPDVTLRAGVVRQKLFADASAEAETWSLAGAPGGVIRIRHGRELSVRLVNDTPAPLSLHWHGVRGPNGSDGVGGLTQAAVAPGASHHYRFTPPDPGTYLVRPLVLGRSGEPSGRGLAALLVVEEREPVPVAADYALLVRDWLVEPAGGLAPFGTAGEAALGGRLGNRITVDGADAPRRIEAAPNARLRIRLANAANARAMRIRFDGLRVFVAAVDGQPTDVFEPLRSTLPFPPGTRYDLFLDAPEAGQAGGITALVGAGLRLVDIVGAGPPVAATPAAAALPPNRLLPPEIKLQNAVRRELVIAGGATRGSAGEAVIPSDPRAIWTLGGAAGSVGGPPLFTARRGQPVVLGLHNKTGFAQPMHLHGHAFRLLHNLDDGWEPYWLDTLQVPEGKTSRIAFIADNPGRWLLGSSVLERLDTGLWTWFEVA